MVVDTIFGIKNLGKSKVFQEIQDEVLKIWENKGEFVEQTRDFGDYSIITSQYLPKPSQICESHRKMVDIQLTVQGSEKIEVYSLEDVQQETFYDEEKDVTLYSPYYDPHCVVLSPMNMVVLLPEDVHIPGLPTLGEQLPVKKVVVKVPITLF